MAVFVLVHGAFFGAWCWQRVVPRLRSRGHEVHAVTLTGLGERSHLAFVPEHGKSLFDVQVERFREMLQERAAADGEGWKIPALDPSSETLGVTDGNDVEWLRSKLTAHPLRTLTEPAILGNSDAHSSPHTYIFCTGNAPDGSFPRIARQIRGSTDWTYVELHSAHAAMITAPEGLSEKLLEVLGRVPDE